MSALATASRARAAGPARERGLAAAAIFISGAASFGLAIRGPNETLLLILVSLGAFALFLFFVSGRYELTLALFLLWLGLLDGFLKLKSGSQYATLVRDALMFAIAGGAAIRLVIRRRFTVPPYTGWILLFVAVCLVQVANPASGSKLHALAALKPHLEFVPLFFFGHAVMRSPGRIRAFLLLMLAVTALNAIVAIYQYQLTPQQLAGWGPGYARLIEGSGNVGGRVAYGTGAEQFVRPFGLGADVGFSGSVAALAAPGAIALLLLPRRRWSRVAAFALGGSVVLGLVASQARVSLLQAAFAIVVFAALSSVSRRRIQVVTGIAAAVVVSWLVISIVSQNIGAQVFQRYSTISPGQVGATAVDYKSSSFSLLGEYLVKYPFGAGIGKVGPASGFAGGSTVDLNAENEFNYLLLELGYPGLIILCGFALSICFLAVTRVRRIVDPELRPLLMALSAAFIGVVMTFAGAPLLAGPPASPFLWFAAGTLVYWLAAPHGTHPPALKLGAADPTARGAS